jgi:hypothetical protein
MRTFSYPYGEAHVFNEDTRSCLEALGVEWAYSYYGGYPDGGGPAGPIRPETLRHRARHDAGDLDAVRHGPLVGPHGQLVS